MAESKAKAKAREREIERQTEKLHSEDPEERREAALYLGEAASADSIDTLIELYETDEDKSVRKAAAYALGQFKAIDAELLKPGGQKRMEDAITKAESGHLGKRAPTGILTQAIIILLVTAGLMAGLAFLLSMPDIQNQILATPEPTQVAVATLPPLDRTGALNALQGGISALQTDVAALTVEYQQVLGGSALACAAVFGDATPPAFGAEVDADISALTDRLNTLRSDFATARTPYTEACGGQRTLTGADAPALLQPVVQLTTALNELSASATALLSITPTPPPTPTPTLDPARVESLRTRLTEIDTILRNLTDPGGATSLLATYWDDIQDTGSRDNCDSLLPTIRGDYLLPAPDAAFAPNLQQAVELINEGLGLTRTGWELFRAACASSDIQAQADLGLQYATGALDVLTLARERWTQVNNGDLGTAEQ